MEYRRTSRRRAGDRRNIDLGPPEGAERRQRERRKLPDRRSQATRATGGEPPLTILAALQRACRRVDAMERRLGLNTSVRSR